MSGLPLHFAEGADERSIGSSIADARLWRANLGACVLHAVQGLMMLGASQGIPSVKAFKKDLTTSYLVFDPATKALVSQTKRIGSIEIGVCAAIFLLLSAIAHGWVLAFWKVYINDIVKEINRCRWYEYALSSSVMICAIAVCFGCYDVGTLVQMFFVNASMNLFGLMMERLNPADRISVDWTPFVFGCIAGVAPWITVLSYFLGGGNYSQIPGFVYGILFSYFVFFNTFPINMALQYARVGKWADYRFGELSYITLSLVSKSLLAWLVFGGTFQPNGN
mmetsp:Transcript_93894/g.166122  ORF Transcript_93894/g.166122 Transcript_93894/m.166122 type:complete len:279 (-) Transcript_93894:388-1224(-)